MLTMVTGSPMYTSGGKGQSVLPVALNWSSPIFQPAPETEEEMMVEIFKYTERVVNMIRPRKVLFMAIGACPV